VVGLQARPPRRGIRVVDAFNEALSHTNRGKQSTYDWNKSVRRFMRWLAEHHPNCRYWHLMTRQVVREYLDTYDGKSATHKRLSLQPICQTSGYMHREYAQTNFAERLGIGSKLKSTPKFVYLHDGFDFLAWLKENEPRPEAGAALRGLAGMQLQEVTRLM
jgi:hypothetical protein